MRPRSHTCQRNKQTNQHSRCPSIFQGAELSEAKRLPTGPRCTCAGPGPAASHSPIEMVTPPSQGHMWSRWLCKTGNPALLSVAKGAKYNLLSSQFRNCVLVTTSLWKAPYRKRHFALNHVLILAIAIVLHCTT